MGLRTGDLLIAVDGQEWDTLWKLRRQAEASHGLERTVWTVLRDGTRVELPLNGTHIADAISPQNKARDSLFMNPALHD
jgi:S1-C subfamily serine protease